MPSSSSSSSSSDASSPRSSPEPTVTKKKSSSSTTETSKKRKANQPEIEVDLALPEPPSKKAKRALKKGKPLPAKKDSDDEENEATASSKPNTTTTTDDKKQASAKKERSPYGIWIGNLRFTVTRDELRAWLVDNSGGAITDALITRVHLPASAKRGPAMMAAFENRGFAYVDFATYDATVAAIALSETEWHRRRVLIKDATSFAGRPEEHGKKKTAGIKDKKDGEEEVEEQEQDVPLSTSQKIFVGNLSFQTTEDDVRDLFAKCGEIAWVKIATFEDSGKCKGYGWVKFIEPGAAESAVKGFVKIKEVEETEEDFMDVDDKEEEETEDADTKSESDDDSASSSDKSSSDSGSDEDDEDKKPKAAKPTPAKKQPAPAAPQKVKMRKWWVNTLHGRRLKIEHAEDDETRYKKRFGGKGKGGGPKQQQQQQSKDKAQQRPPRAATGAGPRHNNNTRGRRAEDGGGENKREPAVAKEATFTDDINTARLTGGLVKPQGKKTTFE